MRNTLERIIKCLFKTKMDKRRGFWQVQLNRATQELLAFVTSKGCVFCWKVMPFGVANAPALFQQLMKRIAYILTRRPLVQGLMHMGPCPHMQVHVNSLCESQKAPRDRKNSSV